MYGVNGWSLCRGVPVFDARGRQRSGVAIDLPCELCLSSFFWHELGALLCRISPSSWRPVVQGCPKWVDEWHRVWEVASRSRVDCRVTLIGLTRPCAVGLVWSDLLREGRLSPASNAFHSTQCSRTAGADFGAVAQHHIIHARRSHACYLRTIPGFCLSVRAGLLDRTHALGRRSRILPELLCDDKGR